MFAHSLSKKRARNNYWKIKFKRLRSKRIYIKIN